MTRREELNRRYADAIVQFSETGGEFSEATCLALEAIHDEPWARWW